jgi:hypothetical protein
MTISVKEYIPNINEKPRVDIHSEKFNHTFRVVPAPGGFVFYKVEVSKGSVPKQLEGLYSKMHDAVKAVEEYCRTAPVSKAKARDNYRKTREAQKEAE